MIYEIAHVIKERFSFLWNMVEWGNAALFGMMYGKKMVGLDAVLESISSDFRFRVAKESDVKNLVDFFARQPEKAFEFFKPHLFDVKSVRKVVKNKAFLTFVVSSGDQIVGYFFLRSFVNGKAFRGKMVDRDWQGRGIAKSMGVAMTKVSQHMGLRMFGSISPENFASMSSAKASNDIKVLKTLENGYFYIEFLPKCTDNQFVKNNLGGGEKRLVVSDSTSGVTRLVYLSVERVAIVPQLNIAA